MAIKTYAGIGSRETPAAILLCMKMIAVQLAHRGYRLRSGAAEGADSAFEAGCDMVNGKKDIFIPWDGFNGRHQRETGVVRGANDYTEEIAAKFHPNWAACSNGARALHARNVCQVLGFDRETPAKMVICWTPEASGSGGTGQAIRIAKAYNVPVYDLGNPSVVTVILRELELI